MVFPRYSLVLFDHDGYSAIVETKRLYGVKDLKKTSRCLLNFDGKPYSVEVLELADDQTAIDERDSEWSLTHRAKFIEAEREQREASRCRKKFGGYLDMWPTDSIASSETDSEQGSEFQRQPQQHEVYSEETLRTRQTKRKRQEKERTVESDVPCTQSRPKTACRRQRATSPTVTIEGNGRSVEVLFEGGGDLHGQETEIRSPGFMDGLRNDEVDIIESQVANYLQKKSSMATQTEGVFILGCTDDILKLGVQKEGESQGKKWKRSVEKRLQSLEDILKTLDKKFDQLMERSGGEKSGTSTYSNGNTSNTTICSKPASPTNASQSPTNESSTTQINTRQSSTYGSSTSPTNSSQTLTNGSSTSPTNTSQSLTNESSTSPTNTSQSPTSGSTTSPSNTIQSPTNGSSSSTNESSTSPTNASQSPTIGSSTSPTNASQSPTDGISTTSTNANQSVNNGSSTSPTNASQSPTDGISTTSTNANQSLNNESSTSPTNASQSPTIGSSTSPINASQSTSSTSNSQSPTNGSSTSLTIANHAFVCSTISNSSSATSYSSNTLPVANISVSGYSNGFSDGSQPCPDYGTSSTIPEIEMNMADTNIHQNNPDVFNPITYSTPENSQSTPASQDIDRVIDLLTQEIETADHIETVEIDNLNIPSQNTATNTSSEAIQNIFHTHNHMSLASDTIQLHCPNNFTTREIAYPHECSADSVEYRIRQDLINNQATCNSSEGNFLWNLTKQIYRPCELIGINFTGRKGRKVLSPRRKHALIHAYVDCFGRNKARFLRATSAINSGIRYLTLKEKANSDS